MTTFDRLWDAALAPVGPRMAGRSLQESSAENEIMTFGPASSIATGASSGE